VSLGTVEPPAPCARPSGNGQGQDISASPRLGSGASQPSPTSGPNGGHRRWPRQDNGCLAAAGLTAPLPAASLGPDLPCTDDPELFFAESPDDVEMRCPGVSGQGSNRIFAGKDGGSNVGGQESQKVYSGV
jgi:hypothetical protein